MVQKSATQKLIWNSIQEVEVEGFPSDDNPAHMKAHNSNLV
jgi:hypothetical protein